MSVRGWRQYYHVELRQTFSVGYQRVDCRGEQFNHFWCISGFAGLDLSIKGALQCKTDPAWRVVPIISEDWIVHHVNAPSHMLLAFSEILAEFNLKIAPSAPNNSTSPTFFYLQMKKGLKGKWFNMIPAIQTASTKSLNNLASEIFHSTYEQSKETLAIISGCSKERLSKILIHCTKLFNIFLFSDQYWNCL